jgi:hypothetical protein|tara:strand:+ start:491 stop:664 length:174 start_codon:yes stop_codon:yes gene_type:complete
MTFHDLAIGQAFLYKGEKCIKVQPVKISCCKLKRNAMTLDDKDVIVPENQKVELVNE